MSERMPALRAELDKMNIAYDAITILQDKDDVVVARVYCRQKTCIIKYFASPRFRREIFNYQLLYSLGIPTIERFNATDTAILLEDIDASTEIRLGTTEDLADEEVAVLLAKWYRSLHQKGQTYVTVNGSELYDETDVITLENIFYYGAGLAWTNRRGITKNKLWTSLFCYFLYQK